MGPLGRHRRAGLAAALNFLWIFFQPFWTIFSVSLALLVIYALAAYGGHRLPSSSARG